MEKLEPQDMECSLRRRRPSAAALVLCTFRRNTPRTGHREPHGHTGTRPQARNLLERRQHLIQTLITHGLVVGPHVTISITGFSQKLPTEQRGGGLAGREEEVEEQGPRATLGQWSKRCGAYLKMFHFEATSARTALHN